MMQHDQFFEVKGEKLPAVEDNIIKRARKESFSQRFPLKDGEPDGCKDSLRYAGEAMQVSG